MIIIIFIIMKPTILLLAILLAANIHALSPTNEILLFPNTEASPSLYLISFTLSS